MSKSHRFVRGAALFLIATCLSFPQHAFAQSALCVNATLMCPDQGATTYPASINAPNPNSGNNYGCLGSQPNPAWFYLHVGSSGGASIDLTNSQNQDIDYAMWGPFSDLATALGACGTLPVPTDCSFHPQANETVTFPSANPGDIFLLLITNFSNQPTEITASDLMWPNSNFSCVDPACYAAAGDISNPVVEECFESPNLVLSLPPVYSGAAPDPAFYEYTYLISDADGTILFEDPEPDLSGISPGTYQVCGLSYHINDSGAVSGLVGQNITTIDVELAGNTPPFCGDVTDICVDVIIYPEISEVNLPDEYICPGDCVLGPDGSPICAPGFYTFNFFGAGGCDSVVNLLVIEKTLSESFITIDICERECTIVAGEQVCAPGPHQLVLLGAGANGCDSVINIDFNEISINAAIDASSFDISCGEPIVVLDGMNSTLGAEFEWKDVQGDFLGDASQIDVSHPGEYILNVSFTENGLTCTDKERIFIGGDTLAPLISTGARPAICFGETFDLQSVLIVDINQLNPALTYHNASPVNASNEVAPSVSPQITTTYYIASKANGCIEELPISIKVKPLPEFQILDQPEICEEESFDLERLNTLFSIIPDSTTYHSASPADISNEINSIVQPSATAYFTVASTLDDCTYEQEILVSVLPKPEALFDLENEEICLTDSAKIEYAGTPPENADFNWDFGRGVTAQEVDPGSFVLKYASAGEVDITLSVTENGCSSDTIKQILEIADTLDLPVVFCQPGRDSILFRWSGVGASDYEIEVLTGQSGSRQSDTSFVVKSLSLGEEVSISLEAKSPNGCASQIVQASCITDDCPSFLLSVAPIDTICLDASARVIQLFGRVEGGDSSGYGFWSGTGIVDTIAGFFDPRIVGAGAHSVFYNYVEAGCRQSKPATILVRPQPVAEFVATSPICIDEATAITFDTINSEKIFNWNIDGGIKNGNEIIWNTSGQKSVELTVVEKGCISDAFVQEVDVNELLQVPVINCIESSTNILFEWGQVLGAKEYEISINGGGLEFQMTGSFLVNDLQPGDEIEIIVTANSETACPNVSASKVCIAKDCPDFEIEIEPIDTICREENTAPIQLTVTVGNSEGIGTGIWSGAGVSSDGIFDPNVSAPGNRTVLYTFSERGCIESEPMDILIQPMPNADFTVPSATCVGKIIDFDFSIPTEPTAIMQFDWDFSQNDINAGAGPLGVSWSEPGTKTVSLTIKEGQCISKTENQITVFEKTDAPIIQCFSDPSGVDFSWEPVLNATDYRVEVLDKPLSAVAAQPDDFSISFENMVPGDSVTIHVTVSQSGSPCGESESTKTCVVPDCPEFDIEIQKLQSTCFTPGFSEQLTVDIEGDRQGGVLTWEGDYVSVGGKFEPVRAGVFEIGYLYVWEGCEYSGNSQIKIDTPLNHPRLDCESTETAVKFLWNTDTQVTSYQVEVLSGHQGVFDGNSYTVENLLPNTKVRIDLTAEGSLSCGTVSTASTCVTKDCPPINFEINAVPGICLTENLTPIFLKNYVKTDYPNSSGHWTWTGLGVSSEGFFNPEIAGIGRHLIQLKYSVFSNCHYEEQLTVEVFEAPVADASSEETTLDCVFTPIIIGGERNNDNSPAVFYEWEGESFLEKNGAKAVTDRPGTYVLTAIDESTGCFARDEIRILPTTDIPKMEANHTSISCYGNDDGSVSVNQITGGTHPYLFALNNENFSFQDNFQNLSPGSFKLILQDANFCTDTFLFEITEPEELKTELRIFLNDSEIGDGETIEWGDEIYLEPHSTPYSDEMSIEWLLSDSADFCTTNNCSQLRIRPDFTREYSVKIENKDGCFAVDKKLVRVKRTIPVFVPSGFSPRNADGINDVLEIFAKPGTVTNIKTFRVFDRWGALVFENTNFLPAGNSHGWDGYFRGKLVDSGVYLFFVEIELTDGRIEILEGDVTVF